ncbi:MAG: PQQ-binding-like beta-propeller repeat protein [Candidatus Cohnella colombiensis]|uniref:PQQ-binding-like beta-propeller repeat protein n=1 Tax=Candidatus Cohnella colombiensis TaxID=3121368 RepID=A0AA95JGA9_9BACL|nr:MAG: PQQ-binding-like beta-propeller repeat protein [Cohnella sp.]
MKKSLTVVSAVLAASLTLSACSTKNNNAETASPSESPSASPTASGTTASYENFPSVHYNLASTRHVPFTEITKENVNDLGVVWSLDVKSVDATIPNGSQNYATVIDGIAYVSTSKNHVFALNAVTGEQLWHWVPDDTLYENSKLVPIVANRGVAVAEGKVFMLMLDNRVVAIDQKTGETVKIVKISDAVDGATVEAGYYETSAPVYYKGNIYIGSSGSDNGVRGFVMAYKASDLTAAWDAPFWTVPPKGEEWLKTAKFDGGGAVWGPITIDEETGIMYFGTGNPAPDFYGAVRPGANPHTDSVVALDSATGKLIWAKEEINHDLWDYDAASSPLLIKANINGTERKVVTHGGKSGLWFAWDAATGDVVYDKVQFAKKVDHPDPTVEGVMVYPGIYGGQNYAAGTYDPNSNYALIPGIESPTIMKTQAEGQEEVNSYGTGFGAVPEDIVPFGTVTAIDVSTGKVAYQYDTDHEMRGGFTSTASGLAFYGELNGKFRALDIQAGKVAWEFQTTGDNIMSAPSIFTVGGKEYILQTTGGTKPQIIVFALGGDKTQGKTSEEIEKGAHD